MSEFRIIREWYKLKHAPKISDAFQSYIKDQTSVLSFDFVLVSAQ